MKYASKNCYVFFVRKQCSMWTFFSILRPKSYLPDSLQAKKSMPRVHICLYAVKQTKNVRRFATCVQLCFLDINTTDTKTTDIELMDI